MPSCGDTRSQREGSTHSSSSERMTARRPPSAAPIVFDTMSSCCTSKHTGEQAQHPRVCGLQRQGYGRRGAHSDALRLFLFQLPRAPSCRGANFPANPLPRGRLLPAAGSTTSRLTATCCVLLPLLHHLQLGSDASEVLTFGSEHLLEFVCQLAEVGLRLCKEERRESEWDAERDGETERQRDRGSLT
jgi:hypothetical protein